MSRPRRLGVYPTVFQVWTSHEATIRVCVGDNPGDVDRLHDGPAKGPKQSVQHLSPIPGLVQGFGGDADTMGHTAQRGYGDHEAGK